MNNTNNTLPPIIPTNPSTINDNTSTNSNELPTPPSVPLSEPSTFPTTDNKPPPPTINTIHMPGHYSNPMYNYPYPTYSPQTHPPWYYHMLISYILMILHLDLKIIINHHHIHYINLYSATIYSTTKYTIYTKNKIKSPIYTIL
eukprot:292387_1